MRIAPTRGVVAATLLALLLIGFPPPSSLPAAAAAPAIPVVPQPNGSEGALFVYSNTGNLIDDPGYVFARSEPIFGSASGAQLMAPIAGTAEATAGSTESFTFISSAANIRAGGTTAWEAWAPGTMPAVGGIVAPALTASRQTGGDRLSSVFADVGGTYHLGVAFTRNNGVTVDFAAYRTMRILPNNRFTLDPIVTESSEPDPSAPGLLESGWAGSADAPLLQEALDAEVPSEVVELVMPAAQTISLGEVGRGDSTDAAPSVMSGLTVIYDRSDGPGWQLTMTATDFVSGTGQTARSIPAAALGYAPVADGGLPPGISLGAPKAAGAGGTGQIAAGGAGSTTTADGVRLELGLTFRAPPDAAPGNYTSTVSFTLIPA